LIGFWLFNAIEIEGMMLDLHTEHLFDRRFDILYPGIAELDHFSGIGANNVVMLLGSV